MTWSIPIGVFFTSINGWQYFVGRRTVQSGKCYVQYMDDAVFNCILQVSLLLTVLARRRAVFLELCDEGCPSVLSVHVSN